MLLRFDDDPPGGGEGRGNGRGYRPAVAVLGSMLVLVLLCCGGLAAFTGRFGFGEQGGDSRPPAVQQDGARPGR